MGFFVGREGEGRIYVVRWFIFLFGVVVGKEDGNEL